MKAGKFSMVSRSIWRSERFKSLRGEKAKLVYFYFLTSEHQNGLGCYRLPDGYAVDDLGWPLTEYQEAKRDCVGAGLIRYDSSTQELLVEKWLVMNPAHNKKHLAGLAKTVEAIESDQFRELLEAAILENSARLPDEPIRPYR